MPSLATGHDLDTATWGDFVTRLHHDCAGPGVHDHCTSAAIFIVQARRIIYGLDLDYSEDRVILVSCDEAEWFSIAEYWEDADEEDRTLLNGKAQELVERDFMDLDEDDQFEMLAELDEHQVTGYAEHWEYINAHFTKDAAEAFIRRKKHDYGKGMRVYVESNYWAWEFNAIKEAILAGTLTYTPKGVA